MAQQIEVKVPDIGDFKDVAVIEVLVKPGETVAVDTSLIMVESDKASMEIPSSHAGVVKEVKVKVDDKVSEGSTILVLEAAGAAAASAPAAQPAAAAPPPVATAAASYSGKADIECDMLVLGAGPGGYSAAFRAADLGMKTVLVERYDTLGGVCLNVGCIPSKALLHTASVVDEVRHLPDHGISYGPPQIDLAKLRGFKDGVIKKLTGGLAGMAKARKVEVVTGVGAFLDPHHLEVVSAGGKKTIKFAKAIIAAGSQAVKLPFLPEDPRIVDSTGALLLKSIPKRMLVIGGGIIGLEMATVYSTLGARIDVVEMLDGLMQGADRDLVKVWEKMNAKRFDKVM
ncbi:MAG: FAD-dependent oxidoreductase, partial [Bradyrhizobium sp.]